MPDYPNFKETEKILLANVKDSYQIHHSYTVSKVMEKYSHILKETFPMSTDNFEPERWAVCGLIHDWDYGFDPEGHPQKNINSLRDYGYPKDILDAILGHALFLKEARTTKMAQALLAIDETVGLLFAYSKMKGGYQNMEVKGVLKKFKDKSFAAKINRNDILTGVNELGITMDQHITNILLILKSDSSLS